jgi:hypothetical protein
MSVVLSSLFVIMPSNACLRNVLLLPTLGSARKKNDQLITLTPEINPVSRSPIYPVLAFWSAAPTRSS